MRGFNMAEFLFAFLIVAIIIGGWKDIKEISKRNQGKVAPKTRKD
jgi:hypothetical protein